MKLWDVNTDTENKMKQNIKNYALYIPEAIDFELQQQMGRRWKSLCI